MKLLRLALALFAFAFFTSQAFAQPMLMPDQSQPKAPQIGKTAPKVEIAEYLNNTGKDPLKGKIVFLEFWATWCGPCRQTIPHLNKLVEKFQKNVSFVSVSNENKDVVQKFMGKTPMKSFIALDKNNITSKNYNVQSIPQAYIIDKKGNIAWAGHPATITEDMIENYIKTGSFPKN